MRQRLHRWWRPGALLLAVLCAACLKRATAAGGVTSALTKIPAPPTFAPARYGEVTGAPVIDRGALRAMTLHGDRGKVSLSYVRVDGQPFPEALRAEVKQRTPRPWDLQLLVKTTVAVAHGDVLLATFWFRAEPSRGGSAGTEANSEGQTELVFELGHEPWTKSVSFPVRAGVDWRRITVPFVAQMDYPAGEAKVDFRLGFAPQTIDIGGLSVETFGRRLALSALPIPESRYRGMEPDAPWRQAAAARIDKLRKGDLAVIVKDRSGQPVVNAEVNLHQTRQAFGLGTCVNPALLEGPDGPRYRATITELFNIATLENNLKWTALAGDWGPRYTLDAAKDGIAWLRGQGLDVRGHVLIWPGWRNLPRALRAHEQDPAFLESASLQRIRDVVSAVKGTVVHWDVINEPFDNHDLMDNLGDGAMVDWFKAARAVDPGPKLFINDDGILTGGGGDSSHRASYEKTIKFLVDNHAPFDGIGMEGHFGSSLTGPEDLLAILDRFAKFKKVIWVTEYDIDIADEEVAGKFTRDFYTTLFSHPAVGGIVMWGFWQGAHWKSNAPLYHRDWSLKPAGAAFRELALETWRTDAHGRTDAGGTFATRGFLGDYDVGVAFRGKQKAAKVRLEAGGSTVTVVLE